MATNKILVLMIFLFLPVTAMSQNGKKNRPTQSGLMLSVGPSVNYYQGTSHYDFDSFDNDNVSWQINGFIGYKFSPRKHGSSSNLLAVFINGGYTTPSILNRLMTDQGLTAPPLAGSKYHNFYQGEAGFYVGEFLRLSTGLGTQELKTTEGEVRYNYLSSTIGISINLGNFSWVIDSNFLYGRDFPHTIMRLSTGISIIFDFQ